MMKKIDKLMENINLLNLNRYKSLDTRKEEMIKINEEKNKPNPFDKINIIDQQKNI